MEKGGNIMKLMPKNDLDMHKETEKYHTYG